ncbi:MAG: scavenger receptor cysteine-rich domain-containing protein, partial [Endozoicomonadaceae bacterium]|nr:scavenger receptor cysteine-rich domain-containing protein [Endozoicomonadaceae bacterium]
TLKIEKKSSITRESLRTDTLFKDLNNLTTLSERVGYINKNRTIPLTEFPVFSWLLKEYSLFYDEDKSVSASLNTISGMLYDLLCRAENNNDAVAKLVLVFLNRPVKISLSEQTNSHSLLTRCKKYFSEFLFTKKTEKSFSEQLTLLTSSPYTEEKYKQQKLLKLINAGYQYNKNYTFTSYEPDENGKNISDPSDHIVLPAEQSQQLLNVDYPVLGNPDDTFNRAGVKFLDNYLTQITALATLSMFFLPAANAFATSATPSSQCTTNIVCGPHNTYPLHKAEFALNLKRNPKGCFVLGQNITLNQYHQIPGFNNCNLPFSGEFNTGDYTLSFESTAGPIFGCIDQATIKGNFNFCTDNNQQTVPVISYRVLNNNTINIQQADSCETQRPAFSNIAGNRNQIIFSGNSKEIRVASGAGIVARQVSGNNNTITIMQGKSHNSPAVFTVGGNYNTYYQQDMSMTRFTDSVLADNKLFTAERFTGKDTNIVQNNINATLFTVNEGISNKRIPDTQNAQPNIFSTNANINVLPIQDSVRLTNISDNSVQRTILKNNGRIEISKDNNWQSVCEDTLDQKSAHAICKILGYREAESEGLRLSFKQKLPTTKLKSSPIHLNKQCTGYERDLQDCNTTAIDTSACRQNEEAFLSCHNRIITHPAHPPFRLTDHTSNRTDRFDTTNTGIGRLELKTSSQFSTVCSYRLFDSAATNICNIMGFNGGNKFYTQSSPLPIGQILASNVTLQEGGLLHWTVAPGDHNCNDQTDLVLKCNPRVRKPFTNFRLADRHSIDEHRANTLSTGLGRLEWLTIIHDVNQFLAYCPENIDENAAQALWKNMGFDSGSKSHLTAKPLPPDNNLDNEGGRGRSVLCTDPNPENCIRSKGSLNKCSQPFTNVVLWCKHNDSSIENIPLEPKNCSSNQNQILSVTTTLFSGSYDMTGFCKINNCPFKLWNINSAELSDSIRQQCGHTQQLDITNRDDWLTAWNTRCKHNSAHRNCHLPYEQLLGLVAKDIKYNEVLLISRQTHPDNETINAQGLVLVSKLFSNEIPQVLDAVSEELTTGILPVDHIITEGHLISIYPSEDNTSVQLFWSPLENSNKTYHAQTYNINGTPLVLTQDSVFIKNMSSQSITRHAIDSTTNHNIINFNLNHLPSDNILLPESIVNAFTGTVKDGWLYLSATDNHNNGQIYIISYNLK